MTEHIDELVEARRQARAAKDFARADELRAEIEAAGYELHDTPSGPVVERATGRDTIDPSTIEDVLSAPATIPFSFHLLYEGFFDDLERFLRAFETHCDTLRAEVVVVDNASPDGARIDTLLEPRPYARALHLGGEVGWAAARNAGLKTSAGALVVLVDLSVEPKGDLLGPLDGVFTDGSVAVAGPFGLVSDDMRSWHDAPGPAAHAIEGYLLATRRELLAQGLINERFKWYRNADIDLSFQLRAAGGDARVVPLPVDKHEHRGWEAVDEETRARLSKRNHYTFFDRWKHRMDLLSPS